jgi:hypothetical protein
MPPVWNHRAPSPPKIASQSIAPRRSRDAAVCPRSEQPRAARIPNPRSVKFSPLRTDRPTPSYGTQETWDRSTPPWSIRSSSRRPIGLSASAVTIAVRSPKHRRRPRATLYSPPPSHARKLRAVEMRPSPGSRRSITSPSDTTSHRAWSTGRIASIDHLPRSGAMGCCAAIGDAFPTWGPPVGVSRILAIGVARRDPRTGSMVPDPAGSHLVSARPLDSGHAQPGRP